MFGWVVLGVWFEHQPHSQGGRKGVMSAEGRLPEASYRTWAGAWFCSVVGFTAFDTKVAGSHPLLDCVKTAYCHNGNILTYFSLSKESPSHSSSRTSCFSSSELNQLADEPWSWGVTNVIFTVPGSIINSPFISTNSQKTNAINKHHDVLSKILLGNLTQNTEQPCQLLET